MKTILLPLTLVALCAIGRSQDNVNVDMQDVLGPNNTFHDRVVGVSFTYPAGWKVLGGFRWGIDHRENTFRFRAIWPSEASPSLYYQAFRPDSPRPADVRAWLLEAARRKEESRQGGTSNYRNDPDTLVVRTFAGRPGMSYLATFGAGERTLAEYNLRIVGEKAYVMFFTMGPLEDVLAIRREIDQMAETVNVP